MILWGEFFRGGLKVRQVTILTTIVLLTTAAFGETRGNQCDLLIENALDHLMVEQIGEKKSQTIGASIGLFGARTASGTWTKGYGKLEKRGKKTPDATTFFEVGSNSKTFTAALIMELVNEGKIHLTDTVDRFMGPSYPPPHFKEILPTVQNLLNHTSAFPRGPKEVGYTTGPKFQAPELFSSLKNLDLAYAPGTQYGYSNLAFGFLTVILEQVEGKPYEQILKERILIPLKMSQTWVSRSETAHPNEAKGYSYFGPPHLSWSTEVSQSNMGIEAGSGAVVSTAGDMLLWLMANAEPPADSLGKSLKDLQTPTFKVSQNHSIGSGWEIKTDEATPVFHKAGQTRGYGSHSYFDPAKKQGVVLLTNHGMDFKSVNGDFSPTELLIKIAAELKKLPCGF